MIQVRARPGVYRFEPATTALVVIDMQRDFLDPGGLGFQCQLLPFETRKGLFSLQLVLLNHLLPEQFDRLVRHERKLVDGKTKNSIIERFHNDDLELVGRSAILEMWGRESR